MKYVFYSIFVLAIIALTYYLSESIRRPVNFQNNWTVRKTAVYKQLEDIVELQKLYKTLRSDTAYAGSFDSMLNTFLTDSFSILRIEGDPYDTIRKADTVKVRYPARDSIAGHIAKKGFIKGTEFFPLRDKAMAAMKNKDNENADVKAYISLAENMIKEYIALMRVVPFSENKGLKVETQPFEIKAGTVALEGSRLAANFSAPTFEVSTTVGTYMPEFSTPEFSMYNPEFVPTKIIKVGDLNKVTTAGNW